VGAPQPPCLPSPAPLAGWGVALVVGCWTRASRPHRLQPRGQLRFGLPPLGVRRHAAPLRGRQAAAAGQHSMQGWVLGLGGGKEARARPAAVGTMPVHTAAVGAERDTCTQQLGALEEQDWPASKRQGYRRSHDARMNPTQHTFPLHAGTRRACWPCLSNARPQCNSGSTGGCLWVPGVGAGARLPRACVRTTGRLQTSDIVQACADGPRTHPHLACLRGP